MSSRFGAPKYIVSHRGWKAFMMVFITNTTWSFLSAFFAVLETRMKGGVAPNAAARNGIACNVLHVLNDATGPTRCGMHRFHGLSLPRHVYRCWPRLCMSANIRGLPGEPPLPRKPLVGPFCCSKIVRVTPKYRLSARMLSKARLSAASARRAVMLASCLFLLSRLSEFSVGTSRSAWLVSRQCQASTRMSNWMLNAMSRIGVSVRRSCSVGITGRYVGLQGRTVACAFLAALGVRR